MARNFRKDIHDSSNYSNGVLGNHSNCIHGNDTYGSNTI